MQMLKLVKDLERGRLVDLVTDKWKNLKSVGWGEKEETTTVLYILEELGIGYPKKASREVEELKRQELEIKCKTLELKLRNKQDKDLLVYNSRIDETFPPIQQKKLMEMKQEIKEFYGLDYWFKF
nr:hypothetical protein [Tanacetum cinerariifolium]